MEPEWDKALDLIAREEFFISYVYDDGDGSWPRRRYNGGPVMGTLTVGYGETRPDLLEKYRNGISEPEARALLRERIQAFWEEVSSYVTTALNPNQAAALTSFAYNAGPNIAARAPALLTAINERRFADAAAIWKTSVLKRPQFDLSARRAAESALFSEPWAGEDPWDGAFVPVLVA